MTLKKAYSYTVYFSNKKRKDRVRQMVIALKKKSGGRSSVSIVKEALELFDRKMFMASSLSAEEVSKKHHRYIIKLSTSKEAAKIIKTMEVIQFRNYGVSKEYLLESAISLLAKNNETQPE